MHGIRKSIRTDHGSGFKSTVLKDFCIKLRIVYVFCPVGDLCGGGFVERTIQTMKRKLGTEAFSPLYKCLDLDLYILLNDLRKSKHATLNKWPFELNFGRKSNTELSLTRDKIQIRLPTHEASWNRKTDTARTRAATG